MAEAILTKHIGGARIPEAEALPVLMSPIGNHQPAPRRPPPTKKDPMLTIMMTVLHQGKKPTQKMTVRRLLREVMLKATHLQLMLPNSLIHLLPPTKGAKSVLPSRQSLPQLQLLSQFPTWPKECWHESHRRAQLSHLPAIGYQLARRHRSSSPTHVSIVAIVTGIGIATAIGHATGTEIEGGSTAESFGNPVAFVKLEIHAT